jgi:hypothetical protein
MYIITLLQHITYYMQLVALYKVYNIDICVYQQSIGLAPKWFAFGGIVATVSGLLSIPLFSFILEMWNRKDYAVTSLENYESSASK